MGCHPSALVIDTHILRQTIGVQASSLFSNGCWWHTILKGISPKTSIRPVGQYSDVRILDHSQMVI
jgi:hypothetical protein